MTTPHSDRSAGKRDRILAAAKVLFVRNGLRATTMEAIAREAQIAKPTLYAHFADKQAVFGALLEQLVVDKHLAFTAALDGTGPLVDRIGQALAAKFAVITSALDGSAHAEELFAAHHQGAAVFDQSNRHMAALLTQRLAEAGVRDAGHLADLLLASAKGVAEAGITSADLPADLALLTRRLIGPDLD